MSEKENRSFSFVQKFKIFGIISIILCGITAVAMLLSLFGIHAFNFDLDFVGGVKMDIELGTTITREIQDDIAGIFRDVAGVNASVSTSGENGTAVSVKTIEIHTDQRQEIFDNIAERYGEDKVELLETRYVSASVGNDLKRSALLSSLLASVLILTYLAIRFEFRSGLATLICIVHDIFIMLAFQIVFQMPINITFIAAALTIAGYSINASIVVFDRVRENYRFQGNSGNFAICVDKSIAQTMRRSIGTTITTLLPIILIIILGVPSMRIFAIPLSVGVVAGGYSSVFIAGPLWNKLKGIGVKS